MVLLGFGSFTLILLALCFDFAIVGLLKAIEYSFSLGLGLLSLLKVIAFARMMRRNLGF